MVYDAQYPWRRRYRLLWLAMAVLLSLVACTRAHDAAPAPGVTQVQATPRASETPSPSPTPAPRVTVVTPAPSATPPSAGAVFFAVIGDFGRDGPAEAGVAELIHLFHPEFIVTVGDNNYPNGSKLTWPDNVEKYYGDYIARQAFFPALGNHDWGYGGPNHTPYQVKVLDYLPGNRRYYELVRGPVHFFVLDSNWQEPDGATSDSKQARWLQERLAASTAAWKVVVLHHAPYSSGQHGPLERMQWPFAAWGADVVLAGHDHTYERIMRDGIVYIVNGLGGASRYRFEHGPMEGSVVRFNEDYGVLFVWADEEQMRFEMRTLEHGVIDAFLLVRR